MTTNQTIPQIAPVAYVPKRVTNAAMLAYLLALVACNILYVSYALPLKWWVFGLVEVLGFFYMTNHLTKAWIHLSPKGYAKNVFWLAFALRVAWVGISYILHQVWTGTAFSIDAGDELYYDEVAHYAAGLMRDGNWRIYSAIVKYSGGAMFSDMGYPLYLSLLYWIFGDSILVARIVKALLGAWTAVLMYKLATRNFGEYTGRMVGIMCLLMPNLIYYCSFQLKEIEMVFLTILFAERADYLLRRGKLMFLPTFALMLIPAFMFMIRTALAATLVLAFFCALIFSSERVVSWGRRTLLILLAGVFAGVILLTNTAIGQDIQQMWENRGAGQQANMEWRSIRGTFEGTLNQRFARYAGASVFAPLIFTLPFPTMNDVPDQTNQKMIHGGNFVKNILSYFTIMALAVLLYTGKWRRYVLPLAIFVGYLVVLVFSNFAQSERFHQPILPFTLMFAAYGISIMREKPWIKKYFTHWCILMFIAALAWNWFKLAGRGML